MKKLIVSVLLILIAGGAAFYFGTVSLQIESDSTGILFSKTRGWDNEIIKAGELRWIPDALLPTNVTIYQIKSTAFNWEIDLSGKLENADIYSSYLDENHNFTWHAIITIRGKLLETKLPWLFKEQGLRPESLQSFLAEQQKILHAATSTRLHEFFDNPEKEIEHQMILDLVHGLLAEITPYIEIKHLTIDGLSNPDLQLYRFARQMHELEQETRIQQLSSELERTGRIRMDQNTNLEVLRQYGELFTAYPQLLDFLALDTENTRLLLSSLREQE